MNPVFETGRLICRLWTDGDKLPFRIMNADPDVMEFFPSVLSSGESDALYDRIQLHHQQYGYGLWAVDLKGGGFIGFIGFKYTDFPADFTPCVEIGWRLDKRHWGKGLAAEGAVLALQYGFETLNLKEVYSFTACINHRSERVMQKVGMVKTGEFNHPLIAPDHRLCRHVLYKSSRSLP